MRGTLVAVGAGPCRRNWSSTLVGRVGERHRQRRPVRFRTVVWKERVVRVLGVDPGLTRCGLGVVDGGAGRTVRCVAVDVVRTPVEDDLSRRLLRLATEVERWLDEYRPDVVAIERVFSQYNVRTAMGTAQAGGVVALAAARRDLPVMFHTPSEVKAAVTGSGRADKAQVTTMVTRLLRLTDPPRPADTADALALAICHL